MYGKPAMTCFKYQVNLYGSEPSHIRSLVTCTESTLWGMLRPSHPLIQAVPPPFPLLVAALPSLVWLNCHYQCKKSKKKNCMVEKP
jgi:hypothetical protein